MLLCDGAGSRLYPWQTERRVIFDLESNEANIYSSLIKYRLPAQTKNLPPRHQTRQHNSRRPTKRQAHRFQRRHQFCRRWDHWGYRSQIMECTWDEAVSDLYRKVRHLVGWLYPLLPNEWPRARPEPKWWRETCNRGKLRKLLWLWRHSDSAWFCQQSNASGSERAMHELWGIQS